MDHVYKALSDPTRRRILNLLKANDMSVTDINSHFDITMASLSHHLSTLKRADLVISQRNGQQIIYSLNTSVMDEILKNLIQIFQK